MHSFIQACGIKFYLKDLDLGCISCSMDLISRIVRTDEEDFGMLNIVAKVYI